MFKGILVLLALVSVTSARAEDIPCHQEVGIICDYGLIDQCTTEAGRDKVHMCVADPEGTVVFDVRALDIAPDVDADSEYSIPTFEQGRTEIFCESTAEGAVKTIEISGLIPMLYQGGINKDEKRFIVSVDTGDFESQWHGIRKLSAVGYYYEFVSDVGQKLTFTDQATVNYAELNNQKYICNN